MYQNMYGHGGSNGAFPPQLGAHPLLPTWMLPPPGLPGPMLGLPMAMPAGVAGALQTGPWQAATLMPGQPPSLGPGLVYGQVRPTAQPPGPCPGFGATAGYGHALQLKQQQPPPPPVPVPMGPDGAGGGGPADRPRRRFTEAPPGVHQRDRTQYDSRQYDDRTDASRHDRDREREREPRDPHRDRDRYREQDWDRDRDRDRDRGRYQDRDRGNDWDRYQNQGRQWGNGGGGGTDRRSRDTEDDDGAGRERQGERAGAGTAGRPPAPPPQQVPPVVASGEDRTRGRGSGSGGGGSGGGSEAAGAAPGAGPGGTGGGGGGYRSRAGHVYTVLGVNIRSLVAQLTPSEAEVRDKEQVLQAVRQAAAAAFPEARGILRVEPFGSYMCGLGTRSSDIDVVLVGLAEPSATLGFYSRDERPRIARLLDRLTPSLRTALRPSRLLCIRHARVPIAKITTQGGTCVDISIAGMGGPRAAAFIRQQVTSHPALRPLVLVLKSYLKAEGLAEVATGGLSSYGLTYMIMAHLMEESRRGSDPADLGALLHSCLRRFGRSFDCTTMAVSVGDGGLVAKSSLRGYGHTDHGDRIVTIDPLTGRNCTEGTYRSGEVLDAFARADAYLAAWAARPVADVPPGADILGPLLAPLPEDEDDEPYAQAYAPPAGGAALGKRGRSQELLGGG